MKKSGVCPKCGSKHIGHLDQVTQRTEGQYSGTPVIGHTAAPLGIERTEQSGFIKVIKEGPLGQLEAYLCGDCGFYETYVKDPASLSYDLLVGFQWL
jgi:predicted nucleic-acid-binding Zn-ribbon protein